MSEVTVGIQRCIDRLKAGEKDIRGELLNYSFERLQRMARKMKRDFDRVGRWEQTEDIMQNASLRLYEALEKVELTDARHFFRLAALQIRRELIDMCRHYQGPRGIGANHFTQHRQASGENTAPPLAYERAEVSQDPRRMQEWSEFHDCVQQLPEKEREVVDLLWYHELSQDEAAELLGISTRQVKRLWRSAKLQLHTRLEDIPGQ